MSEVIKLVAITDCEGALRKELWCSWWCLSVDWEYFKLLFAGWFRISRLSDHLENLYLTTVRGNWILCTCVFLCICTYLCMCLLFFVFVHVREHFGSHMSVCLIMCRWSSLFVRICKREIENEQKRDSLSSTSLSLAHPWPVSVTVKHSCSSRRSTAANC